MTTENCPATVTPLSQAETIKNNSIINLNYTNQEFWSLKSRMVEFLNERFGEDGTVLPNTFNDLVESSIAIMLIENLAFLGDTLSFKMDQIANEFFLDTVTEADNAFRLAKLVGFEPTAPLPSRSKWTATLTSALTQDVTLATPLEVDVTTDDGPITIELFSTDANGDPLLDDDIVIPAGQLVIDNIIGLEGKTTTNSFLGTGVPLQTLALVDSPVIYDSVSVRVDGVLWEKVNYFTDSHPRREFRVEYDSVYSAYVMFGNNTRGLSPSNGADIEVTYRVGGGTKGNIVTSFVETQRQAVIRGLGYTVPVGLRNYTAGQYGYDGDTIEDIRRKLPIWARTQNRAVTGLDYKTISDLFVTPYHGQVGKSVAVLRNKGCAANIVDVYILARNESNGLIEASDELKSALYEEFDEKKMITDYVCIKDGTVIEVDITIEAVLNRLYRKYELEIKTQIENVTNSYFDLINWEYGQDLTSSSLTKALSNISRVDSFNVSYVTSDSSNSGTEITAQYYEIIRPDSIEISFMYE
jgi:hypothetical protein